MKKPLGIVGVSPFAPINTPEYTTWRAERLANAKAAAELGFLPVKDPKNLLESERQEILRRCEQTNFALYQFDPGDDESDVRDSLRRMAQSLGMGLPEGHRSAGDKAIVALTVSEAPGQRGYIPYSRKAINWHTDGYYNPPESEIRSFILHCGRDATTGGLNQILDHTIAYIRLRDENPAYIDALMHPQAMTIPANIEPDGTTRPASVGPVFAADNAGHLTMRYTARTRSIEWRDDPLTREAADFLRNLLMAGDPLMLEAKLQPGQGVLNNNVLHTRTAFDPTEVGDHSRRLMYRVRFHKRIGSIKHGTPK